MTDGLVASETLADTGLYSLRGLGALSDAVIESMVSYFEIHQCLLCQRIRPSTITHYDAHVHFLVTGNPEINAAYPVPKCKSPLVLPHRNSRSYEAAR